MFLFVPDRATKGFLPPGLDEDVRSFLDEQFGAGQCHAGGSAGDHRDLAIELSHDHSVELMGIRNSSVLIQARLVLNAVE